MIFSKIWGAGSYLLALFIAVYIVAMRLPKRGHFALRMAACCGLIVLYKFSADSFIQLFPSNVLSTLALRVGDSFVLYCFSMFFVGFCFESDIWAMMFCATAGYCMQHMSQRTYLILRIAFLRDLPLLLDVSLLCLVTVLYYLVLYFAFIRKADYRGTMLDNRIQVTVSCIAVGITIFLNSFANFAAAGDARLKIYIMAFSVLAALLSFYVEFGWLAARKAEVDKQLILQMAEANSNQYRIERDVINMINIKCHDLKHQLAALDGMVDAQELNSIRRIVDTYDALFATGNHALDIVLTKKSLLCESKGITLTSSIDGHLLCFLSDAEVYSLFSNLLDNAIEAVEQLNVPSRRLISLTGQATNGMFVVHEENYLLVSPEFENGMPKTTKENQQYHGFGTKSIRMICEKYHGQCQMHVAHDIFEVDLFFPIETADSALQLNT